MVDYVNHCPIWGEPHEAAGFLRPETRTYEVSRSPRAGNGYKIDEVLLTRIHRRYGVTAAEWAMRGKGRRWSGHDFG